MTDDYQPRTPPDDDSYFSPDDEAEGMEDEILYETPSDIVGRRRGRQRADLSHLFVLIAMAATHRTRGIDCPGDSTGGARL